MHKCPLKDCIGAKIRHLFGVSNYEHNSKPLCSLNTVIHKYMLHRCSISPSQRFQKLN